MKACPDREYNIEGNPSQNLMDFIRQVRPHQATLSPTARTVHQRSRLELSADAERLAPLVAECRRWACAWSLFMDPVPVQMAAAKAVGADRWSCTPSPMRSRLGARQQAVELKRRSRPGGAGCRLGRECGP